MTFPPDSRQRRTVGKVVSSSSSRDSYRISSSGLPRQASNVQSFMRVAFLFQGCAEFSAEAIDEPNQHNSAARTLAQQRDGVMRKEKTLREDSPLARNPNPRRASSR